MNIKIKCTPQEFGNMVRACACSSANGGCYNCIIGQCCGTDCCEAVEDVCDFEIVAGDSDG